MPTATIRARSLPYRETRATERTCTRCGIGFKNHHGKRDGRYDMCRDCRAVEGVGPVRKPPAPRKPRPHVFNPDACGTPAGWSRHRRADIDPCGPCDEAQRQYERDYYHTKRKIAA